jgi:lipopolysaccharide transport system ATP-binding protein
MSSEIAIKVENLSKCYQIYGQPHDRLKQSIYPRLQRLTGMQPKQYFRKFWALKDVSFEIKKGETIGIIGRNGSGKSTLLQLICGTLSPTVGTVATQGRVAALLELGAGFNTEFTGRENVLLNASILGFPREEILAKMDQILAFSELGVFIDQPVKTYSSGMFVRLAFSTAIHVDPAVLIVDEALAVGDARFQAKCMRRIKDIRQQGTSILFVSHDVASVRTLCDRAVWLDNGLIVDQGDVFPVTGRYMEFMFKDEQTGSDNLPKPAHQQQKSIMPHVTCSVGDLQNEGEAKNEASLLTIESKVEISGSTLDSRPVTHWGSDKGIILSAVVCDDQGNRKDIFLWGDTLEVTIDVHVPREIPREHLSVAFSIKDMKGTDLIVSTTHDFENKQLPDVELFKVSFRLNNLLVTGMYLLVAAVENRQNRDIHYYEYVEGAHYFSSLSKQQFFGIFQPPIEQKIQIIND